MTTQFRLDHCCPACGTKSAWEPAWKQWIRNHNDLDSRDACLVIGDNDVIAYRYGTRQSPEKGRNPINGELVDRSVRYHMNIEVKTHGDTPNRSEAERLWVTDVLLRTAQGWKNERDRAGKFTEGHDQNARHVYVDMPQQFGGQKQVELLSYGSHLLQLSHMSFEDSSWFAWDGRQVSLEIIADLLAFRRNPFSLQPMKKRMHKRERRDATLFDIGIHDLDVI